MPTKIKHRNVNIITVELGEALPAQCHPGDILLVQDKSGWWTRFVGDDGEIESYDEPFDNYNKALWTAKAAAEYASE